MALIMNRVWLAVLLGVIVGLGAGMVPSAQLPAPSGTQPQMLVQNGRQPPVPVAPTNVDGIIVALLVGLVVATPLFLVARRRGK